MSDETTERLDELATRCVERMELTEDSLGLSFCTAQPMLRYVARWNRWMTWTGRVWIEDDTLSVYDRIRVHIRATTDEWKWAKANIVAAVERLAKSDRRYAATKDLWDRDDWLLNTPTGIVDLRTGELSESCPEAYITKLTAVGPSSDCPEWLRFLAQITAGDKEYQKFLQRVSGYAATGTIREHAVFFLYGPGGNGKGTFLNTLQRVFGAYATVAPMETFTESHTDRHPTELAMLRGARLVLVQETEEGRAWAESRLKALTGGDPISARYMRQDFFTFEPKFKLLIAGNHKPKLKNVDEAMKRRLHLLPFTESFKGDRCDTEMADKLIAEAEGILKWVVKGAMAYHRDGLNPPEVVMCATAEYFAAENLFEQWLDECCDRGSECKEKPTRLFNSWKNFADSAGEKPGAANKFGERMEAAGFERLRSSEGRFWIGLKLKPNRI